MFWALLSPMLVASAGTTAAMQMGQGDAQPGRRSGITNSDAQLSSERRVVRIVALATILGFVTTLAPSLIARGIGGASLGDALQETLVLATFAALVLVGMICGVAAALIAGSDYLRRRTSAVILFVAMSAAVTLGLLAGDLVYSGVVEEELGRSVAISFMAALIPVLVASLLGYAIGREQRVSRERGGVI